MIIQVADRLQKTKEYYFSSKMKELEKLRSEGRDIINIAIGNPDLMPSRSTLDELIKSVNNPELHGYPPYRGIPQFREAVSTWYLKKYKVTLNSEDEILPLIGSKEGITHISLTFVNPGDKVLVPELGYPAYRSVTEMIGGISIDYPMVETAQGWLPDFEGLEKMDLQEVKLMWLNYPHMPTGTPASTKLFESFVSFAEKHNILLCHDNPYSLILNESDPISLLSVPGAKKVAIELNSMSKSHNMAGWRIGWIAGDKEYLDEIIKIKSNVDTGMFKPLQLAAVKALENSDAWHDDRNDIYRKRKVLVYKILDQLNCVYTKNQVGMFIWARLPDGVTAVDFVDHLLYKQHIFVSPGFIFGPKGSDFIRVSLCNDVKILNKVIDRLRNFDLNPS